MSLVERLRSSAKAFRENPVYDSEGDGVLLVIQADECDEAADTLTEALRVVREARDMADALSTLQWRFTGVDPVKAADLRDRLAAFISQHEGEAK